jgi:hypothetical protein
LKSLLSCRICIVTLSAQVVLAKKHTRMYANCEILFMPCTMQKNLRKFANALWDLSVSN